jgi:membrane protein YdbS with pleckstrin-like domain
MNEMLKIVFALLCLIGFGVVIWAFHDGPGHTHTTGAIIGFLAMACGFVAYKITRRNKRG